MSGIMKKFSLLFCALFLTACAQAEVLLEVKCDNSPHERAYILEDNASFYAMDLNCRITEAGRHVIYRFDTNGARIETINLILANSYKISLSLDGKTWRTFAVVDKQYGGLSNMAVVTLDTADFLAGAEQFYLKSEHYNENNPGFGGCLFSITLLGEGNIHSMRPSVAAARRENGAVKTDGVLDEEAWTDASWAGNFSMYNSTETPSQPTYAAVLWDDENLYFGFKCYDIRIGSLEAISTTRDGNIFSDNVVEIFLQPGEDLYSPYWHLAVNPASVQFDGIVTVN